VTATAARRQWAFDVTPTWGWTLFGIWLAAALVVAAARPGELFEIALIGVAGAISWLVVRSRTLTATEVLLTALAFATPLLDTWPVRVYDDGRAHFGVFVSALTAIPSLLVVAATITHLRSSRRRPVPRLYLSILALLALAVVTSSAFATHRVDALAAGWISLLVPCAFGLLLAWTIETAEDVWRYATIVVAAGLVPATIGIAAYVLELGFPTSGADLVLGKVSLFRPHLLQDITFGNVGHLADMALALLLPALALVVRRGSPVVRVAGVAASLAMLGAIILTLSRSTLTIAVVAAAAAAITLAWRSRTAATAQAAACALLVVVLATPAVRQSFSGLVPAKAAPAPAGSATRPPGSQPGSAAVESSDVSEKVRVSAISTGFRVFRHHAPFGVGSGQYPLYDPVHTAPHSLGLQLLAENGIFGATALAVLVVLLVWNVLRVLGRLRRRATDVVPVLVCGGAALAVLLEGLVAGLVLSIGDVVVWPLLLFLLTACSAPPPREVAA
jgi:hypothetical protein